MSEYQPAPFEVVDQYFLKRNKVFHIFRMEPLELVLFALHLQGVSSVHTCGKRPFIPCVEACICTYIYVGLQPRSQGLFPPLAKEKDPGNEVGRAGSHMQILGFVVAFASAFAWHV